MQMVRQAAFDSLQQCKTDVSSLNEMLTCISSAQVFTMRKNLEALVDWKIGGREGRPLPFSLTVGVVPNQGGLLIGEVSV